MIARRGLSGSVERRLRCQAASVQEVPNVPLDARVRDGNWKSIRMQKYHQDFPFKQFVKQHDTSSSEK